MSAKIRENDPLLLDRQVCFPLYAATNLLNRLYTPVLSRIGLTYSQYLVMLVLWEDSPQTVGALGKRLYVDSGTLTPLLKRMEAAEFITRRRDPEDERRVLIALTPKGRRLRTQAAHVPDELSKGIEMEEIEQLRDHVRELVTILATHVHSDGI